MELNRTRIVVAAFAAAIATLAGCDTSSNDSGPDLGMQATIGLEFVQQRGCATCHAAAGSDQLSGSDTPLAGTMAYASNLTSDTATGLGAWADIEIVRAMRFGVDNMQQPLCPPSPHYDGSDAMYAAMTDVEAAAIVAYLRTLAPVAHQVQASMCPPLKPPPPVDMAAPPATDDMAQADHD